LLPSGNLWIAIVQNANSSALLNDLDAALQRGSSEKRIAALRQITDLFLSETDRMNERQVAVLDGVVVQLIERIETRKMAEISARLAPVAKALIDFALNRPRHSGARFSENDLATLLRGREASARSA
jgi:hypothetical protein